MGFEFLFAELLWARLYFWLPASSAGLTAEAHQRGLAARCVEERLQSRALCGHNQTRARLLEYIQYSQRSTYRHFLKISYPAEKLELSGSPVGTFSIEVAATI